MIIFSKHLKEGDIVAKVGIEIFFNGRQFSFIYYRRARAEDCSVYLYGKGWVSNLDNDNIYVKDNSKI